MGVYVNTFRTEFKVADLNGQKIKVYAMRYLCKHGDEDDRWGDHTRRAGLLQARIKQSKEKFSEHKPAFIAHIEDWEDAVVHAEPKQAIWYDTEEIPAGPIVGFMRKASKGWIISSVRHGVDYPQALGNRFRREYVQRIVDGKIERTNTKYVAEVNNVEFTEEQFQAWRTTNEPIYLQACKDAANERARQDAEATAARQAKLAAKDAEIAEAARRLQELQRERAAI